MGDGGGGGCRADTAGTWPPCLPPRSTLPYKPVAQSFIKPAARRRSHTGAPARHGVHSAGVLLFVALSPCSPVPASHTLRQPAQQQLQHATQTFRRTLAAPLRSTPDRHPCRGPKRRGSRTPNKTIEEDRSRKHKLWTGAHSKVYQACSSERLRCRRRQ